MALFVGIRLGASAGLLGGIWDAIIMRTVDLLLAFPILFLLIACIAMFGSEINVLVLILVMTSWMDLARIVRAEVLSLKQRDFIKSAIALGFSKRRILFVHLLPNLFPPIIAIAVLRIADIILLESSISFLGLGVQPPGISWGTIIRDGRDVLATAWWITAFPGLAITTTTISFHWIGGGIRKAVG
ncbi:MAG: ABC transporter permease [Calditrichaeota bacterium]|nr:MAG: ABC transporter permease [Calditrichota bacterium]